jgi:hypothetical protein
MDEDTRPGGSLASKHLPERFANLIDHQTGTLAAAGILDGRIPLLQVQELDVNLALFALALLGVGDGLIPLDREVQKLLCVCHVVILCGVVLR